MEKGSGPRDLPQIDGSQVEVEQFLQQFPVAAGFQLLINRSEISMVFLFVLGNIEDGMPPFVHPRVDELIAVAHNEHANVVRDKGDLVALKFDRVEVAGDEIFDFGFSDSIAGPKGFVAMKEKRPHQVCVEPSGDITWVGDWAI